LNFVSDRGANLVKALKPYSTTNCVAHRFNNVVKVSFYQTNKKKRKNNKIVPIQVLEMISLSDSENDTDDDEDKDEHNGDEDGEYDREDKGGKSGGKKDEHLRVNKGVGCATSSCILDYSSIKLSDIPLSALNILKTIGSCKSLVRYVKKVRTSNPLK
jgi:hypothetical protein